MRVPSKQVIAFATRQTTHRRSQWSSQEAMAFPKVLAFLVILCFERRYPKQNTLFPKNQNFGLASGYVTEANAH